MCIRSDTRTGCWRSGAAAGSITWPISWNISGKTRSASADGLLRVDCENGVHNLTDVLGVLQARGVPFARVYSEPPTLNDVFLEITGKELRDPVGGQQ